MRYPIPLLLSIALLLAGCQGTPLTVRVNERVLDDPGLITGRARTLLLPMDVEIKEMSVSGVSDVVPAWTRQSQELIRDYLQANCPRLLRGATLVTMPEQSADDERVRAHIDLAHLVWADAFLVTRLGGPAWEHKIRHFDYGIGPGLEDLAAKTGADRALLIIGEDVHTTAGRKAMAFGLAALGVTVPLGHTFLAAVLIDLHSGDILWMNSRVAGGATSLREAKDVASILDALFDGYPGIEAYRKLAGDD